MKIEILQENLNHSLSTVARIIANRPQIPILANILLVAKNGRLTLTASNLETSVVVETGAKIITEGEFTVPGRTFSEIINSLSAEKISLEVTEGLINIKTNQFQAHLNGIAAAEYPRLSEKATLEEGNYWEIASPELIAGLEKTIFAAASDEGRAVLTGVLFKPANKGLVLASTDGFRLSVVALEKALSSKKETASTLVIPARSLSELLRVLGENVTQDQNQKIKIYLSSTENQVYFDLNSTKIFSRLIAGNFPDYEKIIPSKFGLRIVSTVEEMSKAIRLASIFARDSANIVKFKIPASPAGKQNSKLKISANAAQVGENESVVDVVIDGENKSEEFAIAFNYHYLLDFLSVETGEMTMEFSGPVAPGVFRSSISPDFLHIIMPVRVQS